MKNVTLLILRATLGALLMGHGSQKLFGWFEGSGLDATTKMVKSKGLQPGRPWALLGGWGEFGGGLLTAFGLLNPLGPLGVIGAMAMAARQIPLRASQSGPPKAGPSYR